MAEHIEKLNYQGPIQEWKPPLQNPDPNFAPQVVTPYSGGYHDLNYLLNLLEELIIETSKQYRDCETRLQNYALVIGEQDETFKSAHDLVYPVDDTPGVVTFDEYKYLLTNNTSNASQYIITTYEKKLRGASGNNALDVSLLALHINQESQRIKAFIDKYIGEVDDTSEFRTIELFQDWAEDAKALIYRLRQAFEGQMQVQLPQSELDSLTEVKASEFQALFQTKINVINRNIVDLFGQLEKNWNAPADYFYNRNLGPSMSFRLKVGRSVPQGVDPLKAPTLYAEANAASGNMNLHFETSLADCIKRNQMFFKLVTDILANMSQRDTYVKYIDQLGTKSKPAPKIFTSSSAIQQPKEILEASVLASAQSTTSSFANLHNDLSGLDDPNAHTQYLLREGGESSIITGNILVADGVTIDGVDIDKHDHDGINSKKIHGRNIEFGTLTTELVDEAEALTSIPTNLRVKTVQSQFLSASEKQVEVVVEFDIDSTGISGYEFEIIKME